MPQKGSSGLVEWLRLHWTLPAAVAIVGAGLTIACSWGDRGSKEFFEDVVGDKSGARWFVWWVGGSVALLGLVAAIQWQRRAGHAEGEAAAIEQSRKRHDAEIQRLREEQATALASVRKWYESNLADRLHLRVAGGVLRASWQELDDLRAAFELQLVGSCHLPQIVEVQTLRFRPVGGGEWFVAAVPPETRALGPGGELPIRPVGKATDEDIVMLMAREEMKFQFAGTTVLAAIPGTVVAMVRIGWEGGALSVAVPVTVGATLLVEHPPVKADAVEPVVSAARA